MMLSKSTPALAARVPARYSGSAAQLISPLRQIPANELGGDLRLFRQKLSYLTNRGHWPQIDMLAREHGWNSPELEQFIQKRIPLSRCPSCNEEVVQFRSYTRFCSDSCRRSYRKQARQPEMSSVVTSQSGLHSLA